MLLLAGMHLLAGCAVGIETRLTSKGPGLAPNSALAILAPEEDVPVMDPAVRKALETSLAALGHRLEEGASLLLDAALSDRSGVIGVKSGDSAEWKSPAQKKRLFGTCNKQIHRLTLSIADRKSGSMLYQGQAEEVHCKATPHDSLPFLTSALAADLAKPAGQMLLKRSGLR